MALVGIITTWVMQLFVMSMMISNVLNNNHDHHEYLMDGGIHIQGNNQIAKSCLFCFILLKIYN